MPGKSRRFSKIKYSDANAISVASGSAVVSRPKPVSGGLIISRIENASVSTGLIYLLSQMNARTPSKKYEVTEINSPERDQSQTGFADQPECLIVERTNREQGKKFRERVSIRRPFLARFVLLRGRTHLVSQQVFPLPSRHISLHLGIHSLVDSNWIALLHEQGVAHVLNRIHTVDRLVVEVSRDSGEQENIQEEDPDLYLAFWLVPFEEWLFSG